MVPRKKLDIGWADFASGLSACVFAGHRDAVQQRLERWWSPAGDALAFLSVRSGFDLVLQQLALPRGSEVLVSAITIRDMVNVLEHHGLVAVPLDIETATCAVQVETLERAVTANTRAVLIAHLFGSRMPMDGLVAAARRHGLILFEDCAQAYAGDGYRGHPDSDVAMFSFGTIKTATALGGALFNFRSAALRAAVAARQCDYPVQPRSAFLRKLIKIAALHALSARLPYALFVVMCRAFGRNHDRVISSAVRGFVGSDLLRLLRQRPPAAMLALLERRLAACTPAQLVPRIAAATAALQQLPPALHCGARAAFHSHWVFPIQHDQPDLLVCHLWRRGFDATRGASSMCAVGAPDGRLAAANAQRMMERIVYLPVDNCSAPGELHAMVAAITQFEPPADTGGARAA